MLFLLSRVDPVFNDLHNGIKKSDDQALRLTLLQALHGVIQAGGQRMSEKHRGEILATLLVLENTANEGNRLQAAQCLGVLCAHLSDAELQSLLTQILVVEGVSDWAVLQARATALSAAVQAASGRFVDLGVEREVASAVLTLATSDRVCILRLWLLV